MIELKHIKIGVVKLPPRVMVKLAALITAESVGENCMMVTRSSIRAPLEFIANFTAAARLTEGMQGFLEYLMSEAERHCTCGFYFYMDPSPLR